MNKSVVNSKELRFIYRTLLAMRNGELLDNEEFVTYYNMMKEAYGSELEKYVFSPLMKAYYREVTKSKVYNHALLNQLVRRMLTLNQSLDMSSIDLFKAIVKTSESVMYDNQQESLASLTNNLFALYQVDVANGQHLMLEDMALHLILDLLKIDPTVNPEMALEVLDLLDGGKAKYDELRFALLNVGSGVA